MEHIKNAIAKDKIRNTDDSLRLSRLKTINLDKQATHKTTAHQELETFKYTHTTVIALQENHLIKNRIVASNKNDAMSMNFDLLRTLVLQKMEEKGWRTLAITSPTPEAGKTVIAINLAMSIAQQTNKTAMIVDFDLRRPKIGTYLGLPMEKSLNNFLDGDSSLPDVLVNPDIPRLVVLATKTPVKNSSETLSSKKINDMIHELRERYSSRFIIFDLPPVLVTDDAIALLPQIDCVLLVVANGMSTKQEIESSIRLLPSEKLLGTVFNKAEMKATDHYYY